MKLFILLRPGSLWSMALFDENSILVLKNTLYSESALFEQIQDIISKYDVKKISFGGSPRNYVEKYVHRIGKLVPQSVKVEYEE